MFTIFHEDSKSIQFNLTTFRNSNFGLDDFCLNDEGMSSLSSSVNIALSLPTSKISTSLRAISAVVVVLARHFAMPRSSPHSALPYEEASTKLRARMTGKSRQ
ncbi:hypothetical protein AVEN_203111-1 [Araneus ventricosus]|uniref:Uncharacterized protein n=1 Tax=Araneus ventricosus TaxID=182803 RepID=A0A4Y2DS38_ARAVE|nr:hypothetical protein AVEN_203111-1 [Araneus ventricosus]